MILKPLAITFTLLTGFCTAADEFDEFSLDIFEKGDKMGYRDVASGMDVIPAQYDDADLFFEDRARVMIADKWGYIDPRGNWIVRPMFEYADSHSEGLAVVGVKNKKGEVELGAIDRSGKLVIPIRFASLSDFRGGLAVVSLDGETFGLIDQKGAIVVRPTFDKIGAFRDGRAAFQRNGRWGVIDGRGKEIVSPIYDEASFYTDGRLAVRKGEKWGYLDQTGKLVIPCKYDFAGLFRNKQASVSTDKRKTYFSIDISGGPVSP